MNNYWNKKALKHQGIKGEHAYLQAVEDFEKILDKKIKNYLKDSSISDHYLLINARVGELESLKEKYFKRK